MGIVNQANLDAANTAFETAFQSILSGGVPGVWQEFTFLQQQKGTSAELNLVDGIPQLREWLGSKRFEQLRAYRLNKPIRPWEMSIRIDVDQIEGDRTGVVAQALANFAQRAGTIYDQIFVDEFLANPDCYDGQALLSASHPTEAGTQDNLESAALTYALFDTAREAMRVVTDFKGEPLGITPSHLLVGPAQERFGMELTGSDRPMVMTNAAEINEPGVGTAAIAAIPVRNYVGGNMTLLVSERITGNQWAMMDLTKGNAKPLYGAEFQAPRTSILDKDDDPNVFHDDQVLYSTTCKVTPMGGAWQTIHGSIT